MRNIFLTVCIIFSVLIYSKAEAATILYDTDASRVLGINGLDLGTLGTWNVDFVYGNYTGIFGTSFDFNTYSDALTATTEIKDVLNTDNGITLGKDGTHTSNELYVPYDESSGFILAVKTRYDGSDWTAPASSNSLLPGADVIYSKFSAVPIPKMSVVGTWDR